MNSIRKYVDKKLDRPNLPRFMSAFFCGIIFCMTVVASVAVSTLAQGILSKVLLSAVFPIGLFIIVANEYDLFTSTVMNLKKLTIRGQRGHAAVSTFVIYLGNLAGVVLCSYALHAMGVIEKLHLADAFQSLHNSKTALAYQNIFFLGIFCNFLICMSVYLSLKGESFLEKCAYMFIPVFLFVLLGFEHSIANMAYFSIAVFSSNQPVWPAVVNVLFATLGNLVGGLLFVVSVKVKSKERS